MFNFTSGLISANIRISPSKPTFEKLRSEVDNGIAMKKILRNYKDPNLYSAVIKFYLRYVNSRN